MSEIIIFLWDLVAIASGVTAIIAMTRFVIWMWAKKGPKKEEWPI